MPDYNFASASNARDFLESLIEFLQNDAEPELFEVFQVDHGMPLDLSKRPAWDELFGR